MTTPARPPGARSGWSLLLVHEFSDGVRTTVTSCTVELDPTAGAGAAA